MRTLLLANVLSWRSERRLQHGKSWAATDFIAWVAGHNPDLKTIFASYSDELGTRTNLDLQRMMTHALAFTAGSSTQT
jgi:hypothetical protein